MTRLSLLAAALLAAIACAPTARAASGPAVQPLAGTLVDPAGVDGQPAELHVRADDTIGMRAATLMIDGKRVASWQLGDTLCSSGTGFTCPTSVDMTFTVATKDVALGPHTAVVRVDDAAGDDGSSPGATILRRDPDAAPGTGGPMTGPAGPGTTPQPVPAPAPAPGAPAPAAAILPPALVLTGSLGGVAGRRGGVPLVGPRTRLVLRGRVSGPDGSPAPDTPVTIVTRAAGRGVQAPGKTLAPVTSGADGRFAAAIPGGPSRTIRARLANGSSLEFRVRARFAARLTAPASAVRGRVISFRGDVAGAAGKLIELQARQQGEWSTFRTTTTRADGHFGLRYAFAKPGPSMRYAIRLRVPAESGFPYVTTATGPRVIAVR